MSKQTPQQSTGSATTCTNTGTPNTAEHGCGNGFSLISALSYGAYDSLLSDSSSPLYSTAAPVLPTHFRGGGPSMTREELLSILDDALEVIDREFDDDWVSGEQQQERVSSFAAQ